MTRPNRSRQHRDPQHQGPSTNETALTQGLSTQGSPAQATQQRVPSNQVWSRLDPPKGVPPRQDQAGRRPPDQLLPLRDAALEIVEAYLTSTEVAALGVEDVQPLGRDVLIGEAVGENGAVRLLRLTGLEAVRLWTWASAVGPGRSLFGLSASGIRQARMRRRRDA